MNVKKLLQAEAAFFGRYPGGFDHPEMIAIRKHHKLDRMVQLAQESFTVQNFHHPDLIVDNMIRVITRSPLISMFEKPKFRDFARSLPPLERQDLARGLEELLHGDEQTGFEILLALLRPWKLAKWSLMTVCQAYYRPQVEVFVKPTTAKGIVQTFELEELQYKSSPSWDFYERYRAVINEMKTSVDPSLSPYNIAFTGFLMRSIQG
ncbi:MAG: hypothetical protein ACM3PS_08145 [Syntrophothermus sp.]